MANRSYLYSVEMDARGRVSVKSGVGECAWEIPLAYKVLLLGNPLTMHSRIWRQGPARAILADYAMGVAAFERLLDRVESGPRVAAARGLIETHLRDPLVEGTHFMLEPGEIFDMDDASIRRQTHDLLAELRAPDAFDRYVQAVSDDTLASALGEDSWATHLYFDLPPRPGGLLSLFTR